MLAVAQEHVTVHDRREVSVGSLHEAAHAARQRGCEAAQRHILGDRAETPGLVRAADLLTVAAAGAPTTASAATDATLRVARPVAPDNGLPAPLLQRVERDIRARLPDLGPVRVHATPTPYPKSPDGRTQPMTLTVVEEPRGRPFRQLVKVTLNADGAIAKLVMAHG